MATGASANHRSGRAREAPRRTPLHPRHQALGAHMAEFAGWEMPIRYRGIRAEHAAVRSGAGLFDVSHMGEIEVAGPGATRFCQRLTANDVERLEPLQSQYTLLLNERAGIIDDLLLFRLEPERYLLCVNAARRRVDFEWLASHAGGRVAVRDVSDAHALLALQGPASEGVLGPLTDVHLPGVEAFHFVPGEVGGVRCLVSRTGYTGEDGFELYCAAEDGVRLWDALAGAGGVEPAGLGARDTLRLEKGFALYGREIDETTTPREARLGWVAKPDKGPFIGSDALSRQEPTPRRLVGLEMEEAGIAREGCRVFHGDGDVGRVTSGTLSPTLGKAIALAYVPAELAARGAEVRVEVRSRRIRARVVRVPFVP